MAAARKQGDTAPAAPEVVETGAASAVPVVPAGGDTASPAPADADTAFAPADADDAAPATADGADADEGIKPVGFKVSGAAVVLRTADGAERYLYRHASFPEGVFTEASVEHAVSVGLIKLAE